MMRLLIYLTTLLLLFATAGMAQESKYEAGMQKALQLWKEQKNTEAVNLFERIAKAEKENWVPYYYAAMVNIMSSFGEKDEAKLTLQLNKAKEFIEEAKLFSPNNPEVLVLEAMMHTAWIAFDGATYGMSLSGKVSELHQKALSLAPENPRVILAKAEWDMGSAQYWGKDITPYCADVVKALQLFATFKNETPFYPSWGKERAEEISKLCK